MDSDLVCFNDKLSVQSVKDSVCIPDTAGKFISCVSLELQASFLLVALNLRALINLDGPAVTQSVI